MQDSGDVEFEPDVRDSRVLPVAVVRRTLWHKEQNFASRNFAQRGTRSLQVCGRGQKVAEFSPEIHCRSLFLTDFFAYLHCSAPSTWSKRALSKKKTNEQHLARSGGRRVRFSTPKTPVSNCLQLLKIHRGEHRTKNKSHWSPGFRCWSAGECIQSHLGP